MVRARSALVFAFLWAVLGFTSLLPAASLLPPVARKDPHATQIHGETLVDDDYWLRNKGTPDVESEGVDLFQSFYVVLERESGIVHLKVTERPSGRSHRIEFPEPAYLVFPLANREFDAKLYRFAYQSPIVPQSAYDYDPVRRERKLLKQTAALGGYDPSRRIPLLRGPDTPNRGM